jgi:opacity protein-like surface antigen
MQRTFRRCCDGQRPEQPVDKKSTNPGFSVGASYAFTATLSARLEWERYFDVGDKNTTGKSNVNLFALSVQFTL